MLLLRLIGPNSKKKKIKNFSCSYRARVPESSSAFPLPQSYTDTVVKAITLPTNYSSISDHCYLMQFAFNIHKYLDFVPITSTLFSTGPKISLYRQIQTPDIPT